MAGDLSHDDIVVGEGEEEEEEEEEEEKKTECIDS
jgi:hypothetical protein